MDLLFEFRLFHRKPRLENRSYERKREAAGEAFYPDSGTLIHGTHKDSKDAIDRMAQDVEKQASTHLQVRLSIFAVFFHYH